MIIVIAVLATVLTIPYWMPRRPLASEYFTLALPRGSVAQYIQGTNNRTITLKILDVSLTPKLGDATLVQIDVDSHTGDDESNWADNITKGVAHEFAITLENHLVSLTPGPDGTESFQISITYGSAECQYQETTLYLKNENIVFLPGTL